MLLKAKIRTNINKRAHQLMTRVQKLKVVKGKRLRSCSKGVFGIRPSLAGGGRSWDEHTPNAYEGLLH